MAMNDFGANLPRLEFFQPMLPGFENKLSVPRAFVMHAMDDQTEEAALTTPLGSWVVQIKRNPPLGMSLEEGWSEFVGAHNVSVGDFLVFHYKGNMSFNVLIFEQTFCAKEYDVIPSEQDQDDSADVNLQDRPSIKRIVYPYNIDRNYMAIPMLFRDTVGLATKDSVTFEDELGRLWSVNVRHRSNGRAFFGYGWLEFCSGNDIVAGDQCIFIAMSEDLIKVQKCGRADHVRMRYEYMREGRVDTKTKCCSVCGQQGHYQTTCVLPKMRAVKARQNQTKGEGSSWE